MLTGFLLIAAAQAAAPAVTVAPPDPAAHFSGAGGNVKFDSVCRGLTAETVAPDPGCAQRLARGETAASIDIAVGTIMKAASRQEAEAGLALVERAVAAEDHPAAHYLLGSLLTTGERVPPDYRRGVMHLEKAVAGGNAAAADLLATLLLSGRGVRQDVPRALSLYEKAIAGGMKGTATRLAVHYLQGVAVPKDTARGRALLDAAAAAGHQDASTALAMLTATSTNYQMHPYADRPPELRTYNPLEMPRIPPAFGYTDEFARLFHSDLGDPAILARLERDQATLPTPYLYELARRLSFTAPDKARGYWMLARMRMSYDASRCEDAQAMEAVNGWDMLMLPELRPALAGMTPEQIRAGVEFALAREASLPADARPWWVCYAGMAAYAPALEGKPVPLKLKPAADWPKLRDKARADLKALLTDPPAQ